MGENVDEDEYKFTLFSDIHKNVLAMHEQLNEEVPESSLLDEFDDQNISNKSDDLISDCDDDDDDDVSLSERQKNLTSVNQNVSKNAVKRTIRTRSRAKKSPRNSFQGNSVAAETIVDVIDISDNEVECIEPERNRLGDSLSIFNLSSSFDSTVDEIVIDEDDNKLVSVKVNWMNLRVHRFEIRKFQKFTTIFKELAEKENVPKEKILLILRDTIFISEDDSPDSLKLSIVDIIEGGITKEACNNKYKRNDSTIIDEDMLQLKCVLKDLKKPLMIAIKKTDSMQRFMVKASEQLERPLEKLKFMFEGELLESSASPIDLDMEGGEVIHVHVKE